MNGKRTIVDQLIVDCVCYSHVFHAIANHIQRGAICLIIEPHKFLSQSTPFLSLRFSTLLLSFLCFFLSPGFLHTDQKFCSLQPSQLFFM